MISLILKILILYGIIGIVFNMAFWYKYGKIFSDLSLAGKSCFSFINFMIWPIILFLVLFLYEDI